MTGHIFRYTTCVIVKILHKVKTEVFCCTFFCPMALPAHSGPRPLIQFCNHFSETVELFGRVISPSQGRYLNTGQHKHRINAYTHTPNTHAFSGIRTHDPSVQASYCDRLYGTYIIILSLRRLTFSRAAVCSVLCNIRIQLLLTFLESER
jgi:hypothetical protein